MSQNLVYIHPNAKIGKNVIIEPFTYIGEDVIIGNNCTIGPNVTIKDGARIGKHCQIYPGAVIAGEPQDLKFEGESSTVTIGDNVIVRECVTINRGTALDRGDTHIGNHVVLMAYTHIAHDCVIEDHVILANSVQMAGHVHISEHAFLGGTTAVHQFVKIGAHTMISGGSLVRKDVPPYVTAARDPLSYMGVNSIGLRRRGFSNEKINELQDIYRIFYISGLNNTDALDKIRTELSPTAERDEIIRFIEDSSRGLMRGGKE
ncbi:MAG: acyl-[acyl-carrier-protein]--UDP-N-acetylglucosamine O-acyltransferase [Rickettsiales bacterium]|nr:acyl-[acyl-carrier-protein]--UDP-N-acetylglucosamine O-acyltransferase [Rickettsiales bacterium]